MLLNIINSSKKNKSINLKDRANTSIDSAQNSQDKLTEEKVMNSERAEQEVWRGAKSEREKNLELAIFHYRSAIKFDPECLKAHRLLSNALKKVMKQGSENTANSPIGQSKFSAKNQNLAGIASEIEYRHPEIVMQEQNKVTAESGERLSNSQKSKDEIAAKKQSQR